MDTKQAQELLFPLSYGMFLIGTQDGERPTGCVVNTVAQVTADPVRVAVTMSKQNFTHECIMRNGEFSVTILAEETPSQCIAFLGFRSGCDVNKWEKLHMRRIEGGLPVLEEKICGWLHVRVVDQYDALPTHTIFIGEVVAGERFPEQTPMTYAYYHRVVKGKAPKNAPTYVNP